FGAIPKLIRPLIASGARKQVQRTYHLQGLGRHTNDEQAGFAKRDLEALNAAVEGKTFLFGETPNVFDFTVAAMMAGIYDNEPVTWLT
ncbi:MAG: glutathione S-transferase family protein, partial [Proteobacteria bacterium]|nr:glutathione S-transferase family protein [Pseudomonadota bacterium]